jgi:hypothetical protein
MASLVGAITVRSAVGLLPGSRLGSADVVGDDGPGVSGSRPIALETLSQARSRRFWRSVLRLSKRRILHDIFNACRIAFSRVARLETSIRLAPGQDRQVESANGSRVYSLEEIRVELQFRRESATILSMVLGFTRAKKWKNWAKQIAAVPVENA